MPVRDMHGRQNVSATLIKRHRQQGIALAVLAADKVASPLRMRRIVTGKHRDGAASTTEANMTGRWRSLSHSLATNDLNRSLRPRDSTHVKERGPVHDSSIRQNPATMLFPTAHTDFNSPRIRNPTLFHGPLPFGVYAPTVRYELMLSFRMSRGGITSTSRVDP
jgi:hypothetical protein